MVVLLEEKENLLKCTICKKDLEKEKVYWTVVRHKKEIPRFRCPNCGALITIEYFPKKAAFEIDKPCKCKISISSEIFDRGIPQWKKKSYFFCEDCFKKTQGARVFYAEMEK